MNEREALLRAVCESPDDDTPRLVFADWLDEHDEPERAESIRLQCAVARLPVVSSARRHKENLITHLLRAHEPVRAWELPRPPGCRWGENFSRGFVTDITVIETPAYGLLEGCFDASPITSLLVNCSRLEWDVLFAGGYLNRLSEMTIESAHAEAHAPALCKLRPWPQLKRLIIAGTVTEDKQYVRIDSWTADALLRVYGYRLRLPPRGDRG
ncbi:MAG: TIGR02996 domain-containing protein [Planctomycetes bacterium]|nr:TIGR02996 domain-containing protein [Planctomycetota bacterium]